jgi:hypothetical protein
VPATPPPGATGTFAATTPSSTRTRAARGTRDPWCPRPLCARHRCGSGWARKRRTCRSRCRAAVRHHGLVRITATSSPGAGGVCHCSRRATHAATANAAAPTVLSPGVSANVLARPAVASNATAVRTCWRVNCTRTSPSTSSSGPARSTCRPSKSGPAIGLAGPERRHDHRRERQHPWPSPCPDTAEAVGARGPVPTPEPTTPPPRSPRTP